MTYTDRNTAGWSRRGVLAAAAGVAGSLAAPIAAAGAAAVKNAITEMDALSLSRAIHSRDVSCVEVMGAYLDRIDSINPKVNAIVALQPRDRLLAEARARDNDLSQGRSAGWLHGFPYAPKDLEPAKGLPFTEGSPIFRDRIADHDSLFVGRIRAAGPIFIGKTNTPEFGLGSHTYNPVYGTTRNPYDSSKSAGGSSGGAGAALASRLLPVADGSDLAGSLRNPAAWNNVFGFRTTYGRIPEGGGFTMGMSVPGPMARTAADLSMLLSTMAGPAPGMPLVINEDPRVFAGPLDIDTKGLRIGWLGNFGTLPMEEGVLPLCETALKTFEDMGASVGEARVDAPVEDAWQNFVKLRAWGLAGYMGGFYRDPDRRKLLKPEAQYEVELGQRLSGADVSAAMRGRANWYRAFSSLFDHYDFLALPGAQLFAFDASLHWPTAIAGVAMDSYHRWMEIMTLVTLTDCPALSVPAGFSASGQPMGIQLVAPLRRDLDCLRLANAYDKATKWPERRPPRL